jgi:hypothetical protein
VDRTVPSGRSVGGRHRADWPLGFAEDAVPKLAVVFKVVPSVVDATYWPCQVISMVEVGERTQPLIDKTSKTQDEDRGEEKR